MKVILFKLKNIYYIHTHTQTRTATKGKTEQNQNKKKKGLMARLHYKIIHRNTETRKPNNTLYINYNNISSIRLSFIFFLYENSLPHDPMNGPKMLIYQ